MKDVIKIIYYLVFYYDIHVPDALKLIRYNIFNKTYFSLIFYNGEGKEILKDIIENCGGQIINYSEKLLRISERKGLISFLSRHLRKLITIIKIIIMMIMKKFCLYVKMMITLPKKIKMKKNV